MDCRPPETPYSAKKSELGLALEDYLVAVRHLDTLMGIRDLLADDLKGRRGAELLTLLVAISNAAAKVQHAAARLDRISREVEELCRCLYPA